MITIFNRKVASSPLRSTSGSIRLILALLLVFAITLSGCVIEDDDMTNQDAYGQLYSAIQYKQNECGQSPGYFLIFPSEPTQYEIDLCSISIIRQECPFNDYPLFCLEIYGDLPLIGPAE